MKDAEPGEVKLVQTVLKRPIPTICANTVPKRMKQVSRYYFTNRTMCSILENIRAMDKSKNYSALLGAVEELQWAAERMEAAISDAKDINNLKEHRAELRDEVKKLEAKVKKLKNQLPKKKKKD